MPFPSSCDSMFSPAGFFLVSWRVQTARKLPPYSRLPLPLHPTVLSGHDPKTPPSCSRVPLPSSMTVPSGVFSHAPTSPTFWNVPLPCSKSLHDFFFLDDFSHFYYSNSYLNDAKTPSPPSLASSLLQCRFFCCLLGLKIKTKPKPKPKPSYYRACESVWWVGVDVQS